MFKEKIFRDAGEYHGHSIEQLNSDDEKTEVILEFLRVWIFLGLPEVPGDDDVARDVDEALNSCHQTGSDDGETPGAGNQCSGVEEEVDSGEREDDARDVDDEGQKVPAEVTVVGEDST